MATILCVHTLSIVLRGLQASLEDSGHVVSTTTSPDEARDMLDRAAYQIIICDSEFEVFAEELAKRPKLRVVIFGDLPEYRPESIWFLPWSASLEEIDRVIREIQNRKT